MADLRFSLTGELSELLAACASHRGSLWSCYGEVAARSVFAGGCRGVALDQVEAGAGLVGEGGEHEEVAVDVGAALLLAIKCRVEIKDSSNNVGDRVERAKKSVVEEITLGGVQSQQAAAEQKNKNQIIFQHDVVVSGQLAMELARLNLYLLRLNN